MTLEQDTTVALFLKINAFYAIFSFYFINSLAQVLVPKVSYLWTSVDEVVVPIAP